MHRENERKILDIKKNDNAENDKKELLSFGGKVKKKSKTISPFGQKIGPIWLI